MDGPSTMNLDAARSPSPQLSDAAGNVDFSAGEIVPMANGKNVSPSQSTSTATAAPPSSSKIASMNKRQQAAHRARMAALHKQLTTRLQYAAFKVEHGWSKQSLSEVENLFYKHRRVSGSGYSPNASTTPSTRKLPSTSSLPPPPTTPQSNWRASSPTTNKFRTSSGSASVEGLGGLVTPPASGNTLPLPTSSSSYDRRKSTNQQSPSSNHRKMSMNNGGGGGGGGGNNNNNNSGRSYADFWSKIGGAGTPANGQ